MAARTSHAMVQLPAFKIELDGAELDPEVAGSIVSLRIEQELRRTNGFWLCVQDEFHAGRFRWLESGLFQVAAEVSVSLGYAGELSPVVSGKIQNLRACFEAGQAPMLEIEGTDLVYEALTLPGEAMVFRDKRDSDIVTEIVRLVGGETGMVAEVDATEESAPVKTKPGGMSFLDFIEGLAAANHYKFFVAGNRLHFKREDYSAVSGRFAWGRDVVRFEPHINTTSAATGVVVRGWDPERKRIIEARASAGDEQGLNSDREIASTAARRFFGDVVRVIADRPVRSPAEARRLARAALEVASSSVTRARLEVVGNPDLVPGTCVELEGFGLLFSGRYYIVKTTHILDENGFRSHLELARNTL